MRTSRSGPSPSNAAIFLENIFDRKLKIGKGSQEYGGGLPNAGFASGNRAAGKVEDVSLVILVVDRGRVAGIKFRDEAADDVTGEAPAPRVELRRTPLG